MINIPEELKAMHIVVIEDDDVNRFLLEDCLSKAGFSDVTVFNDNDASVSILQDQTPDLILLNLAMRSPSGRLLLEEIRSSYHLWMQVPILVFAEDVSGQARQAALDMGANDFLSKPGEPVEIILRVRNFLRTRQLYKELEQYSLDLESKVRQRTDELTRATEDCLERLARASEYRDDDTGEHTMRVGVLSALIAEKVGLKREEVELIRRASPLHDIGKIGIPDSVLLKPGKLDEQEYDIVKSHVKIGSSLLAGSTSKLMLMAEEIAYSHHEKWDGTGYSQGLKGEEIPIAGRIVAIADVFDALTHERPYKQAWPQDKAIVEIKSLSGTHFDPDVVNAFVEVVTTSDSRLLV